jgi:serine/threonine protein kinase
VLSQELETVRLSDGGETLPLTGTAAPIDVPQKIGSVRLERELGRGGMGVVWRAHDDVLNRHVAVKFLLRTRAREGDPDFQDLLTGARAAAAVRHPGLTAIHQADLTEGIPYLVMEFIDGPNLGEVLRQTGPFEPVLAARVMAEVSRIVAALHEREIVHRDIKPENVLLSPNGELIVTDFGLACDRVPQTSSLTVKGLAGTPHYMSPEVFDGHVSVRSDVYALGIMAYELLTGDTPYCGTLDEIRCAHEKGELPEQPLQNRHVPEEMIQLLRRLTHPNRMYRAKTAHQAAQGFERIVEQLSDVGSLPLGRILLTRWRTSERANEGHTSVRSTEEPSNTVYPTLNRFAEEKRKRQAELESQRALRAPETELTDATPPSTARSFSHASPDATAGSRQVDPVPPIVTAGPHAAAWPEQKQDRVYCLKCRYNVTGRSADDACPLCGMRIELTLRGNALTNSSPSYLRAVKAGITLTLVAIVAMIVLYVGVIVAAILVDTGAVASVDPSQVREPFITPTRVLIVGQLVLTVLFAVSWWIASSPDPHLLGNNTGDSSRHLIRAAAIVAVAAIAAVAIVELMLRPLLGYWLILIMVVCVALHVVAYLTCVVGSLFYLRWISRRTTDNGLRAIAESCTWVVPLLIFTGILSFIAVILYITVLERLRTEIKRTIQRQAQAAAEVAGESQPAPG